MPGDRNRVNTNGIFLKRIFIKLTIFDLLNGGQDVILSVLFVALPLHLAVRSDGLDHAGGGGRVLAAEVVVHLDGRHLAVLLVYDQRAWLLLLAPHLGAEQLAGADRPHLPRPAPGLGDLEQRGQLLSSRDTALALLQEPAFNNIFLKHNS